MNIEWEEYTYAEYFILLTNFSEIKAYAFVAQLLVICRVEHILLCFRKL